MTVPGRAQTIAEVATVVIGNHHPGHPILRSP